MNLFKLKVFVILPVLLCILAIPAQAEIVTIWGEGKHIMGDNDTKDDARKLALLRAKTMCLEKAGTYLESETIVKDLQLAKDEIKAYTAGIVRIKVVDEQVALIGESPCVTVKVKADIDTSQLDERIKRLRKDEKILDDYKRIQAENERLTKQLAELQKQLEQAKDEEQIEEIKVARKDAFDRLRAVDWFFKAVDEATSSNPNWDLVIEWNKRAIELKPDVPAAHCHLGIAYGEKGLYDKEIASYKKAIKLKPDYADAYGLLGFAYWNKGLHDKAIVSYKKAVELKPDDWVTYNNLGIAYADKGLYNKAIVSCQKAVKLKPDLAEAHGSLGAAYAGKGLYDKAIASLKMALELKPDMVEAHYILGFAYGKKGLYDKEIASYKKAIELKPEYAEAHCNLGAAYEKKGLYDKAIASCKEAIQLDPDDAVAYNNLGVLYAKKGLKYVAADYFYKAGLLFLEQGNRENALRAYDVMKRRMPNHELTSKLHRKLYPE